MLVIHRAYTNQPLLVDINLLTSVFPEKAGSALARVRLNLASFAAATSAESYQS